MVYKYMDNIFHNFMNASKMVFHITHDQLDQVGLYRGQPPLLFALWERDEQSRKELCQSMKRQPATVTKMVKRLENNGFVTSRPDSMDSRVARVCLTQKGKAIEDHVNQIYTDLEHDIFKGFSKEELKAFEVALGKIRSNIKTITEEVGGDKDD